MNKKQWQSHHGFTDQEMSDIERLKDGVNGTIVAVVDNPTREVLRA